MALEAAATDVALVRWGAHSGRGAALSCPVRHARGSRFPLVALLLAAVSCRGQAAKQRRRRKYHVLLGPWGVLARAGVLRESAPRDGQPR